MIRREFLLTTLAAALPAANPPIRIGHRQASMRQKGPDVFDFAKRIPGLEGVELQIQFQGTSLWDQETLLAYKRASQRTGIKIPSLAGVWQRGQSLVQPEVAEEALRKSIRAAEALGSGVILVAAFNKGCPDMNNEASYGPVVTMLKKLGPVAADANVILGLEVSSSPADQKKLCDLVDHRGVKIYYDVFNTEDYGHTGQSVSAIHLLGKSRICQVHCKNEKRLLEESGPVDWTAALKALKQIGYGNWYMFETGHTSDEQCIEATKKNIAFIRRTVA
jgi:sugar phosphate isomerase/epimerase